MASLAHAATGLGQGMLQQRELGRETDRYNQQLGLKEREIGLAERGFEADKSWREKQVRRQKHDKIQEILLGGNLTDTEKKYWEGQLEGLYAEDPELDITRGVRQSKAAKQAGLDAQIAADPSGASGMRNPSTTVKPGMFDTGSAGMFDPLAAGPSNYVPPPPQQGPPAPADYQPITDEQVSSLMRETDPQFNMQQNALRPPEPAPVAQPPTQAQAPVAPPKPRTAREEAMEALRAMANDPNVRPNDRRAALLELVKLEEGQVGLDATRASTEHTRELTRQVAPSALAQQAALLEQMAASRWEREVKYPQEVKLALAKLRAGNALEPSDRIALARLNFDVSKFTVEQANEASDREFNRGKDVAAHAQRDEHFYAGQESRSRTQAEGTLLRIIQSQVTDKNPVTGAVRVKENGLREAMRLIREIRGRGEQVDPAGLNPGFDEELWSSVRTPGFNLDAALSYLRTRGKTAEAAQLKSAYATYHKFAGAASGGGVSAAPPKTPKPKAGTRTGYGAGGTIGPRR